MSRSWYAYDGTGNPFLTGSYRKQSSTPGCINGPVICAIYAENGNAFPSRLSPNMQDYIANGLSNGVAEPAIPVGNKFFVYMKGLSY